MKSPLISICAFLLVLPFAHAQQIYQDNMQGFKALYSAPSPRITVDEYTHLHLEGFRLGGEVGTPALPVRTDFLTVPFCDSITLSVVSAIYDTLPLHAPLYPRQASVCKNPAIARTMAFDSATYQMRGVFGHPLFEVEPLGIARDRQLAALRYWPVQVDHSAKQLIVCRQATVAVRYHGADSLLTLQHFEQFYSPAFSPYQTVNKLLSPQWLRPGNVPIRLAIVANEELKCDALDEFIDFKRSQGLLVSVIYTDNRATHSSIHEQVEELFTLTPAPSFILLIGDHEQLPAFPSSLSPTNIMHSYSYQLDDHVTDHYYTTITDDLLPDCHRGRLPAANISQLTTMIDKTLYYERYQFEDDSYLGRAVLVAGVDGGYASDYYDNAYRCADPTMDYLAQYYINSENGFPNLLYYKNHATYAPSNVVVSGSNSEPGIAKKLIQTYNEGIGWINYSAHGDWDEWSIPAFTVANILGDTSTNYWGEEIITAPMTNLGRPSFMIGNCCLSNHFDSPTCFGEALLRRADRAGAVGYIGCTNSSFWDEDFYWSIGVRDDIRNEMTLQYEADQMGTYDRLFHTHDESFFAQAPTAGAMLTAGLLSVASTDDGSYMNHSVAEYYWEIYQYMGDPTLMPWLGTASQMPTPQLYQKPNERQLLVQTVPYSYVALVRSESLELCSAAYAGADGYAYFTLPDDQPTNNLLAYYSDCFVSITHQGYRHATFPVKELSVGIHDATSPVVALAPNPATQFVVVKADQLRSVQLLTPQGQLLHSARPTADSYTLPLAHLAKGIYLVRIQTAEGVTAQKLVVE